jgi:hypothetical protein
MLFGLDLHIEIVIGDAEGLAVERKTIQRRDTEDTEKTQGLQTHIRRA